MFIKVNKLLKGCFFERENLEILNSSHFWRDLNTIQYEWYIVNRRIKVHFKK